MYSHRAWFDMKYFNYINCWWMCKDVYFGINNNIYINIVNKQQIHTIFHNEFYMFASLKLFDCVVTKYMFAWVTLSAWLDMKLLVYHWTYSWNWNTKKIWSIWFRWNYCRGWYSRRKYWSQPVMYQKQRRLHLSTDSVIGLIHSLNTSYYL